jgi:hypothetical protein
MPTTFAVANQPAQPVCNLDARMQTGLTGEEVLARACKDQYKTVEDVLQFALGAEGGSYAVFAASPHSLKSFIVLSSHDFPGNHPRLIPLHNGFVDAVISAYSHDHSSFGQTTSGSPFCRSSIFVNANVEILRANFVAHAGKEELEIVAFGTRYSVDFGGFAQQMVGLIEKNVVDPTLRM